MNLENLTVEELKELSEQVKEEMLFREEEHARLLRDYENDTQDLINMYRYR